MTCPQPYANVFRFSDDRYHGGGLMMSPDSLQRTTGRDECLDLIAL
jgi:hypothetical protein